MPRHPTKYYYYDVIYYLFVIDVAVQAGDKRGELVSPCIDVLEVGKNIFQVFNICYLILDLRIEFMSAARQFYIYERESDHFQFTWKLASCIDGTAIKPHDVCRSIKGE